MSTSKPRYQISFDPQIAQILQSLAEKKHQSISKVTQDLVKKAIEYDDDAYLCQLVMENEGQSKGETLSIDEFWKENDLRNDEEYEEI